VGGVRRAGHGRASARPPVAAGEGAPLYVDSIAAVHAYARAPGLTKSGRERRVALSRRLRRALDLLQAERTRKRAGFKLDPASLVVGDLEYQAFQARVWPQLLQAAGLSGIDFKDTRDTFASQLLTAGVQLGYIRFRPTCWPESHRGPPHSPFRSRRPSPTESRSLRRSKG